MMKLGIIGLPGSGKTTIFSALTRRSIHDSGKEKDLVATLPVPDARVDRLTVLFKPKKTVFARVEFLLPGKQQSSKPSKAEQSLWARIRECDALIHVIRNFSQSGFGEPTAYEDFSKLHQDL
ncbi:MAG: 50S ribosome-binding GTPase, partial [Deltaproteobacteria bacterium]|nr:50S ribosome-binding GTPase [Deltaproteobacteria bacterium]